MVLGISTLTCSRSLQFNEADSNSDLSFTTFTPSSLLQCIRPPVTCHFKAEVLSDSFLCKSINMIAANHRTIKGTGGRDCKTPRIQDIRNVCSPVVNFTLKPFYQPT
jgi:hypothetical protein